jgi:RNA polymerase sigma factor (sigma-70 family)
VATCRTIAAAPLPEEIVVRQETKELVGLALANMPDNYRQVLREHYFERRSLRDLANTHQTTEGAIKSLLHRARLAFKTGFLAIADALCVEGP